MNELYDLHIVQELYYSSQIFYGALVRARFHPKNSATGGDWRALGHIGNIQNKLLKALYGKGSPKNSATSGHALRSPRKPILTFFGETIERAAFVSTLRNGLKLDRQNMNFLSQSWSAKLGPNFEGQLLS